MYLKLMRLCFLLTGFGSMALAQQRLQPPADPLAEQFYLYKLSRSQATLFVHFDKTIYTNNETVWFTGYLLNERSAYQKKHNIMSVALVRNSDSLIVKQQKFLMASSLSFGSMILPDSMLAGDYHLLATTNRVVGGIPDVVFIQPITIKTNILPSFNASIKILEAGVFGKKPNQVLLTAISNDARFLPKPVAVTYQYGNLKKKSQTNSSGELLLKLDEQENLIDPNVYLKLKYGTDSSFLNLSLPVSTRRARLAFYPEGGHLINGISGRIAFEVKDQQMAVVASKAQLYKDGKVIDTIETNSTGIGHFLLTPEKGSRYFVKLLHSGFADSSYILPSVLDNGVGLYMANAAVKDTLTVKLKTSQRARLFIRVHNFRETYIYNALDVNDQISAKIPLQELPKGLYTLTISDSLNRPLAERVFFAHYHPQRKVAISSDRPVYEQRKKVTLKIRLNGADSLAMASVACVQDTRLPKKLSTDIESYVFLNSIMNSLPPGQFNRGYEDANYMEDILLVKGWRRYTWQDMWNTKATDTVKRYDNTTLSLQIRTKKAPVNQPLQIGILNPANLNLYNTDSTGYFEFKAADLAVVKEKPIYVILGEKNKNKYQLTINDPYANLNKQYLKRFGPEYRAAPSTVQNNKVLSLKGNETAIRLREVEITAGNNSSFHSPKGANECGDYVCRYRILNCINHVGDPGNTQPIPGKTYYITGGPMVYVKCEVAAINPGMYPMDGIYSKKEFYLNDYAETLEPAFASTIYWNNGMLLNKKDTEITFHTSDITGKFRVVVQGVGTSDVIYGDYTFEVKGK